MMKNTYFFSTIIIVLAMAVRAPAPCPLDHLLIGCNADGIFGTGDDNKLFVDCSQKYRHSDPNNSGEPTWLNWYYPLYYNERYDRYQIDEPGFDTIEDADLQRVLTGTPNTDYRIIVECVSITPGFVVNNTSLGITLDKAGDTFNHSSLSEPHLHLQYRAPAPAGATELHWVTCRLYDEIDDGDRYEPSEPFTIVFVRSPLAGDLIIDGRVNWQDLAEFAYYWPSRNSSGANDYYERADADKSGYVDFDDFALLTSNWLESLR